jgi:threonine dehydratase
MLPPDIDVASAVRRLAGVAHRTPTLTSATLDDLLGARVFLKAENLQRVGAFKFRGAYNRVSTLSTEALARGVVAASSGNHAQALALAARLCGAKATILMPEDAPASKREATVAYGAEVVPFDRYRDDREAIMDAFAARHGATVVHPYDDPFIISGAATAGLELLEDAGALDLILVSTGGGGLLAGCGAAIRKVGAPTHLVAVEPSASDDWRRSLAAGRRVAVDVGPTVADGLQLPIPGALNFAVAQPLLDDVLTVDDDEIVSAMRFLFERVKLAVEPSGACALAALLAGKLDIRGLRVAVVLSGGNVDAARFADLVA